MVDLDLTASEVKLLEKQYADEFRMDLQLDLESMSERTLQAPIMKQKWVAKLSAVIFEERQLTERRQQLISSATSEFREKVKLDLSESELSKLRDQNSKKIDDIDSRLSILTYVKGYLEKMVNILSYTYTKDVENAINWHKLETQ